MGFNSAFKGLISTVTRRRTERPDNLRYIPNGNKDFSLFSAASRRILWPDWYWWLSPEINWPLSEADLSRSSSTRIKKALNYTSFSYSSSWASVGKRWSWVGAKVSMRQTCPCFLWIPNSKYSYLIYTVIYMYVCVCVCVCVCACVWAPAHPHKIFLVFTANIHIFFWVLKSFILVGGYWDLEETQDPSASSLKE